MTRLNAEHSQKKILIVAYAFPPIPFGGTYRALRLCRGFVRQDYDCHVLTLKEYADIPNDYELLSKVPDEVHIHRVPIIDPWRRYQKFKNKFSRRSWFGFVNKFVSLLLRFITFPDHMLLWVPFAVIKARKLIKQNGIDTVLISSPPDSSQLVGYFLKKTSKVKWVADFRDPIYGNVAQVNMVDPKSVLDRMQKKLLYRYDRFIDRTADVLIANTETHENWLRSEYGVSSVHAIRNSFDPADFIEYENIQPFEKLTIAHVGSIYGKRNPDLLFSAIKQIVDDYAPTKLNLELVFLGAGSNSLRNAIENYDIGEYVTILDQVSHDKAIEMMCRSHLLLLIKATGKWSRGQIPGKFFEYLGARKKIWCIGPKDSEVSEIIAECNLGHVVEDSSFEMLQVLREEYQTFQETGTIPPLSKELVSQFSSENMVKKFCAILETK